MTLDKNSDLLFTRRNFFTSAGYALAVLPVTAWAIQTADTDLEVKDVLIPVGKEQMPAYIAAPKKSGRYPIVILVHEIFGLHEYIRDVCRRLAKEGYYAVSPYLYFRQGDATKISSIDRLRDEIVNKVELEQVLGDLDATVAWLGGQKSADSGRIAITGFCWGGGVTWMYAARQKKLRAGVAWYGRLTGEVSKNQSRFPLDMVAEIKVPVLGLYGGKDQGIPLAQVEKMQAALAQAKSASRIIVYPDAEHGFHADYRPSYHEASAQAGWKEMLAWFRKNGL